MNDKPNADRLSWKRWLWRFIVLFGLVVAGFLCWLVFFFEGPLDKTFIGSAYFERGSTLGGARISIENAFRQNDPSWTICVHPSVERNAAEESWGAGGTAVVLIATVDQAFRCRCVYNLKEKTISFLPLVTEPEKRAK